MRVAVLGHKPIELGFLQDTLSHYVLPDGSTLMSEVFSNNEAILRGLKRETFDLVFLDWEAPEISGLEVLLWITENLKPSPPVIVFASSIAEDSVVTALNAGADEYIIKPIRKAELFARVNKVLRYRALKVETDQSSCVVSFGNISFDIVQSKVYVAGADILFSRREFGLALLLFKNKGRTLSRGYLYNHLWKRDEVLCSRTLDTHIYRIRTKLNFGVGGGWMLRTVYGYGYCLEALVPENGGLKEQVQQSVNGFELVAR